MPREIILVDDGLTDADLARELAAIPTHELYALEPDGAEGEARLDGQFTTREILLFALSLERSRNKRKQT